MSTPLGKLREKVPVSHVLFRTIIHELIHGLQNAAVNESRIPSGNWQFMGEHDFMISDPTTRLWESNMPRFGGTYIQTGDQRRNGTGRYEHEDHIQQPIEDNARVIERVFDSIHCPDKQQCETDWVRPGWRHSQ